MNQNLPPLISIIVAVYHGKTTLQQCIDSVANQTYSNKELIIIDGGSKDGTVELLKANSGYLSYWVSEPDRGIYHAWNKALVKAKGEWICFLGADDYLLNALVLEEMVRELVKLPPTIRLAYGKVMLVNAQGKNLYPVGNSWVAIKERFKQVMCIHHQGVMHRRSLFEQYGTFDESFKIAGDYELLLRELQTGNAIFIPDIIFAGMRQGGISSAPESSLATMKELRRAQRIHGLKWPGPIWLMAMLRLYIRLLLWNTLGEQHARMLLDMGRYLLGKAPYWTKA